MPVMEPDLDASVLKDWARAIDAGPFSSLCWGERIAFDNPDSLTLLGALSAWTDRVRLVTTVIVPQLHDPVMLAKGLATGDMLSGGRLTVGLGVGGRHEDYNAVGADVETQTMRGMAERVAVMKRVWAGEKTTDSVRPVGPSPVQPGGPPLHVGTIGPKTVRSAAAWADGLAGTTLDLDVDRQNELFDVARTAWSQAGKPKPHLATSFWFAFGSAANPEAARAQVHRHLRRYMNWIPAEYVDAMAPTTGWAGTRTNWSQYCVASLLSEPTKCSSFPPARTSGSCVMRLTSSRLCDSTRGGLRSVASEATGRDTGQMPYIETVASREVYRNPWMVLREDDIRRPDGSPGSYAVVDKPTYALVIPFDGTRFRLVEQFRYPLGARRWEFPQGTAPGLADLEPAALAERELREETGLRAATFEALGQLDVAPGMSSQRGWVFLATEISEGCADREHEEQDMRSAWFPRPAVEEMIRDTVIADAQSIAAYGLFLLRERHLM